MMDPTDQLSPAQATEYMAFAARANYLAQDRPDVAYVAKELCREFAVPTRHSWARLTRLCKYLAGAPRLTYRYGWQSVPAVMKIFVDTDFAGCGVSRRSPSGGVVMLGTHNIRHWSSTQTTIS